MYIHRCIYIYIYISIFVVGAARIDQQGAECDYADK